MSTPILSICIPTYNRESLLARLLNSIGSEPKEIELVIIDDGSSDNTQMLVTDWAEKSSCQVVYKWQANAGRAEALKHAILTASGRYIMPMDSDDYFLDGWWDIVSKEINAFEESRGEENLSGLVFNTVDESGHLIGSRFPSNPVISNLIKVRADYKVAGDKKEIIKKDVIQSCLYDNIALERRVPTALIWAKVSEKSDCVFLNKEIVIKSYQKDGLTKNLRKLKIQNPISMFELNKLLYTSSTYKSKLYRFKAGVQLFRYACHARIETKGNLILKTLGFILYLLDKIHISLRT